MNTLKIESGIWRHFKENHLYFVRGISWSCHEPTNPEKTTVSYHPLYPVENIGWRHDRTPDEFVEHVDSLEFNYSGPRFVKLVHMNTPIYPGLIVYRHNFGNNKDEHHVVLSLKENVSGNSDTIVVELMHSSGNISVPLLEFFRKDFSVHF